MKKSILIILLAMSMTTFASENKDNLNDVQKVFLEEFAKFNVNSKYSLIEKEKEIEAKKQELLLIEERTKKEKLILEEKNKKEEIQLALEKEKLEKEKILKENEILKVKSDLLDTRNTLGAKTEQEREILEINSYLEKEKKVLEKNIEESKNKEIKKLITYDLKIKDEYTISKNEFSVVEIDNTKRYYVSVQKIKEIEKYFDDVLKTLEKQKANTLNLSYEDLEIKETTEKKDTRMISINKNTKFKNFYIKEISEEVIVFKRKK